MPSLSFLFLPVLFVLSLNAAAQAGLKPVPDSSRTAFRLRPVPPDFYKQSLPFTCRQELKLQKFMSLPVYLRLGSKDYVDYLERKPGAVRKGE